MDDYWTVQRHESGILGGWATDHSGPGSGIYDTREKALAWARKLKVIHPKVRLRHTTHTYEEVRGE